MPQRSEKSQQVFLAAVGILTQNLLGNHERLHLNRPTCEVGTQRTTKLRKTRCLQLLLLIWAQGRKPQPGKRLLALGGIENVNTNSPCAPASSTSEALPATERWTQPVPRPLGVQVIWLLCVVTWEFRGSERRREDFCPVKILCQVRQWEGKKQPQRAPITVTPTGHLPRGLGASGP